MSVSVATRDELSSGKVVSENIIRFPVDRMTARQLIEARIDQEVSEYNKNMDGHYSGLIKPEEAEVMLNGYKVPKGVGVDVDRQKKAAIRAFSGGAFYLLVNDRQVIDLEEELIVTPNTIVIFLKLVPLVGG